MNVKNRWFFSILQFFYFLPFFANFWQFSDVIEIYQKKIWTLFLFSSFISILSKIEKNSWEGKKVLFSMLFGHPKMAKMAKKWPAQNKFASLKSNCSCYSLECPFWTWNTAKSLWEPYVSNGTLLGSLRQLQG